MSKVKRTSQALCMLIWMPRWSKHQMEQDLIVRRNAVVEGDGCLTSKSLSRPNATRYVIIMGAACTQRVDIDGELQVQALAQFGGRSASNGSKSRSLALDAQGNARVAGNLASSKPACARASEFDKHSNERHALDRC